MTDKGLRSMKCIYGSAIQSGSWRADVRRAPLLDLSFVFLAKYFRTSNILFKIHKTLLQNFQISTLVEKITTISLHLLARRKHISFLPVTLVIVCILISNLDGNFTQDINPGQTDNTRAVIVKWLVFNVNSSHFQKMSQVCYKSC